MRIPKNIKHFIDAAGTRVFTVTFIKRTTGEVRTMNARLKVTKHLKGGELKFNPYSRNLLPCFDVQARAYRFINFDSITEIKMDGEIYVNPYK